jgi:hypothetical protein
MCSLGAIHLHDTLPSIVALSYLTYFLPNITVHFLFYRTDGL